MVVLGAHGFGRFIEYKELKLKATKGFKSHRRGPLEVGEGDVAGGQQTPVDVAELDHPPVVGPGHPVGEVQIGLVLPSKEGGIRTRISNPAACNCIICCFIRAMVTR